MALKADEALRAALDLQQAIAGSKATIDRLVEEAREFLGLHARADTLEQELVRALEEEKLALELIKEQLAETTTALRKLIEEVGS